MVEVVNMSQAQVEAAYSIALNIFYSHRNVVDSVTTSVIDKILSGSLRSKYGWDLQHGFMLHKESVSFYNKLIEEEMRLTLGVLNDFKTVPDLET